MLSSCFFIHIFHLQVVRMKEVRREEAAKAFIRSNFKCEGDTDIEVKSSWGPYTTTAGTAKSTGARS
jgi:hypothetical protein